MRWGGSEKPQWTYTDRVSRISQSQRINVRFYWFRECFSGSHRYIVHPILFLISSEGITFWLIINRGVCFFYYTLWVLVRWVVGEIWIVDDCKFYLESLCCDVAFSINNCESGLILISLLLSEECCVKSANPTYESGLYIIIHSHSKRNGLSRDETMRGRGC